MRLFNILKELTLKIISLISPIVHAKLIGVKIGRNCLVYRSMEWPSEPYLITIGDNVQLTRGVAIHTHGGGHSARRLVQDFDFFGKVVIEDWAYVGAHSQILPGVTIGEGAIVAAGSIVTKSVAPNTVVAGNPARYLCTVEEYLERNKHFNVHTAGIPTEKKKEILLSLSEDHFLAK